MNTTEQSTKPPAKPAAKPDARVVARGSLVPSHAHASSHTHFAHRPDWQTEHDDETAAQSGRSGA